VARPPCVRLCTSRAPWDLNSASSSCYPLGKFANSCKSSSSFTGPGGLRSPLLIERREPSVGESYVARYPNLPIPPPFLLFPFSISACAALTFSAWSRSRFVLTRYDSRYSGAASCGTVHPCRSTIRKEVVLTTKARSSQSLPVGWLVIRS